jgi:hypothetical protein
MGINVLMKAQLYVRYGGLSKKWDTQACVTLQGRGKWRTGVPKFRSFDKAEPNSQFRGKCIRNNLMRTRVSLICESSGIPD